MDLVTTARMWQLAEGTEGTPYFLKRCVYAVAKKAGGDREALNKAFAVCVAQAQKAGKLKKGSMDPTRKGAKWSDEKKKARSEFSLDRYEKMLAGARKRRAESLDRASLVSIYRSLQEDLQLEQQINEPGVKAAVQKSSAELVALGSAIDSGSLVSIPGILASLLSATLGREGILGRLGVRSLLSAADVNPSSFAQDLKIMVQTFRNIVTHKIDWGAAKRITGKAARLLQLIPRAKEDGQLSPEKILSILGDFFILIGSLASLLVKGIPEKRAKNAALVVRYDMQELVDAFILLAGTAED